MGQSTQAKLLLSEVSARLALLAFECVDKTFVLLPKYKSLPPEETAGLLSKAFFWWLTDTLILGTKRLLRTEDLSRPPKKVQGKSLRVAILTHWGRRGEEIVVFPSLTG